MSVEENYKVVLPNMNLFTDNVNEYNKFRDHCAVPYKFAILRADYSSTKHCYEHRECKCLPPSANENKIAMEQSKNKTSKQKDRRERNNLSFDQVNFMSQFKNLTAAKHFFSLFLHLVLLTADAASLNRCTN